MKTNPGPELLRVIDTDDAGRLKELLEGGLSPDAVIPLDPRGKVGFTLLEYATQKSARKTVELLIIDSSTKKNQGQHGGGPGVFGAEQSTRAWNCQMMFLSGWQRLSECHAIPGDNPAKVTLYDAIVQASLDWSEGDSIFWNRSREFGPNI